MKITIEYEASWRNSFLGGNNNQPVPKKGRDFLGSMTKLTQKENYKKREITLDTVLGVLNRLIGDQRKLYQSKDKVGGCPHYFQDILDNIQYKDTPTVINQEMAYVRNMSGNTDQNSFTGMVKVKDPVFQSAYSQQFWGVLGLELQELSDFIIDDYKVERSVPLDPNSILSRLEEIKKLKAIENIGNLKQASEKLSFAFEKYNPLNNKGLLKPLSLYCSSLYLQLGRLEKIYDMSTAKSKRGGISGISNNGFTPKDFMDRYTTGPKKLIYGNPYVQEEFVKGEGKAKRTLTKASGRLDINLEVDLDKAIEIKKLIDCAGVSSFYLGKKGLAYVSNIDVR